MVAVGITQAAYTTGLNKVVFGDTNVLNGWIGFNWQDVYQTLGNITTTSYSTVAQGRKVDITFNIGVVSIGQVKMIDPYYYGGIENPQIGEFQAPATVYAQKWEFINATVCELSGVTNLVNATLELSNNVVLKWVNSTNTFSKLTDTSMYCTLDTATSQG